MAIRGGLSTVRSLIALLAVLSTLALTVAPVAAATSAMERLAGPAKPGDLHVMTFNLRYGSTATPNSWAQRRPVMRNLLATERPDLIGIQEGLSEQLSDIVGDLDDAYGYVGKGRLGGTRGEFSAILYRKERLTPQAYGNFWLSNTPAIPGSETWGGWSVRMVTWGRFLDRTTGKQFYAVNTHLDNASEYARFRAAMLIRHRIKAMGPIVLTGDFNSPARLGGHVYDVLVARAGLRDSWMTAQERGPAYGTFHGYRPLVSGGPRIDWVLTSADVVVTAALINTYRRGSQFPSDHLPVQVRVRLP
ncbi:endonuclease/exonuclease/phosphatase family protein [Paractinoplanes ovalisporus]|nr:endonuclease/exonuclease/phosphatase family protein [Actinoplanes ovalisporus]